jgi:hypothetical protein
MIWGKLRGRCSVTYFHVDDSDAVCRCPPSWRVGLTSYSSERHCAAVYIYCSCRHGTGFVSSSVKQILLRALFTKNCISMFLTQSILSNILLSRYHIFAAVRLNLLAIFFNPAWQEPMWPPRGIFFSVTDKWAILSTARFLHRIPLQKHPWQCSLQTCHVITARGYFFESLTRELTHVHQPIWPPFQTHHVSNARSDLFFHSLSVAHRQRAFLDKGRLYWHYMHDTLQLVSKDEIIVIIRCVEQ